jgi:electron transport complex protein RnfG
MTDKQKSASIDFKKVIKLALTLFVFAAVAALCLGVVNFITKDTIAKGKEKANVEARQKVLSEAEDFREVPDIEKIAATVDSENAGIVAEAYTGFKNGEIVGYTIKTKPKGYGGDVEVLTGIDKNGKIVGITILSQSETAGLGARSTEEEWQAQYAGLDAGKEVTVSKNSADHSKNEIQAITGATITSKAVTLGVNTSEKVYKAISAGGKK